MFYGLYFFNLHEATFESVKICLFLEFININKALYFKNFKIIILALCT